MSAYKRYMMATIGVHQAGDLSRNKVDLCGLESEDENDYIGRWANSPNFLDVRFPKKTTRELTEEEKLEYSGRWYHYGSWGGQVPYLTDKATGNWFFIGKLPKDAVLEIETENEQVLLKVERIDGNEDVETGIITLTMENGKIRKTLWVGPRYLDSESNTLKLGLARGLELHVGGGECLPKIKTVKYGGKLVVE